MKFSGIFYSLILLLSVAGCSLYNVNSEEITTEFYPPKSSPSDVIYLETVTQPHEVIGYITVNTERRQKMDDVLIKMKREAAILGGDAITNVKTDASGQWKKLPAQNVVGNAYVRANFTATVVVFK